MNTDKKMQPIKKKVINSLTLQSGNKKAENVLLGITIVTSPLTITRRISIKPNIDMSTAEPTCTT